MVLFTGLLITLFIAIVVIAITALIGGAGLIVLFSDVIVCVAIIVWIVKRLVKRNRKRGS